MQFCLKERFNQCRSFFENADFPYAVVKGAVLSSVAYQDLGLRVSGDIDILINRTDADKSKQLSAAYDIDTNTVESATAFYIGWIDTVPDVLKQKGW